MNHSKPKAVVGLPAMAAASLFLTLGHADTTLAPNPGAAVTQLATAWSMRLEALVEVRNSMPEYGAGIAADGLPIDGWFAYSAEGDAWRVGGALDPARFAFGDVEVSSDGDQKFAMAMHTHGLSTECDQGIPAGTAPTLPNLLVELGSWARPMSDANQGSGFELADLKDLTPAALGIPADAWQPVLEAGQTRLQAFLPGAILDGAPYVHRLVVDPLAPDELRIVERVRSNGQLVTRVTFDGWASVDGWPGGPRLPRLIEGIEYDSQGGLGVTAKYTYLTLELEPLVIMESLEANTLATPHLIDGDTHEQLR